MKLSFNSYLSRMSESASPGSMPVEIGVGTDGAVRFVAPAAGLEDPEVENCGFS